MSNLLRLLLFWFCLALPAGAEGVRVFAAASLGGAMQEVSDLYAVATGDRVVLTLAGSSVLARQIRQGAPADLFISANAGWMDLLQEEGLIAPGTRVDLLSNRLVLVAADAEALAQEIDSDLPIEDLLDGGWMAMALLDAVPAGIYGQEALQALGLWPQVSGRIAQSDNVRAALALVARGEARLGVVYASDALAEPRVNLIGLFPEESHSPILYPAAAAVGGRGLAFLEFLQSPAAMDIFLEHGFLPASEAMQ